MSRNRNDTLGYVIAQLKQVVPNALGEYSIYGETPEIEWLTHAELKTKVRLFPDFYVVWVEFQASCFLAVIGQEVQDLPAYLTSEELNAGIFSVLIYELKLAVLKEAQASLIEDKVLNLTPQEAQNQGKERKEIDFQSIIDFFPTIQFFKIDTIKQIKELHQITGELLTTNELYYILPYQNATIEKFEQLFQANVPNLLYENILASYVASDFRFAYLDLYRCIEMLQELNFYESLYQEYTLKGLSGISLGDFVATFKDKTNLEPKLADALEKLLANRPNAMPQAQGKSLHKWLYEHRNSIAHLRTGQTNIVFSETEWNQIICEMLDLIESLYTTKIHLFS
jgi:hypothetical protein